MATEENSKCAELLDISENDRRRRSFWRGCGGLEYRGYDSAGIAVSERRVRNAQEEGKIETAWRGRSTKPAAGTLGLGHTRWATHGAPTDENSHPHFDQSGRIAVVHNGVIENYDRLKQRLDQRPGINLNPRPIRKCSRI